jgi:hypothetical protein
MSRLFQRFFTARNKTNSEILLFENKDKTLIRASYFAIVCQAIFWGTVLDMAADAPEKEGSDTILGSKFLHDQKGILICTGLACLFPLALAYGASKRVKRISLVNHHLSQQNCVVKIESFLPFRNTLYYSLNGMHCKMKAPTGKLQ